ncbi:MAG: DUF2147 domain-containing protein [Methylovirgula sp.]
MSSAAVSASPGPIGQWRVEDGSAVIAIRPCGENLCGYVASGRRSGDAVGQQVFFDMRPQGDRWTVTIVDVSDGQRYSGHISLVSESTLKVEGCAMGGMFCGSQNWSRAR